MVSAWCVPSADSQGTSTRRRSLLKLLVGPNLPSRLLLLPPLWQREGNAVHDSGPGRASSSSAAMRPRCISKRPAASIYSDKSSASYSSRTTIDHQIFALAATSKLDCYYHHRLVIYMVVVLNVSYIIRDHQLYVYTHKK